MKNLFVFFFVCISGIALGQTIENASFENWEMEGTFNEPVDWSSIQTGLPTSLAAFAPEVMFQSTDARTGTYSVRLKNINAGPGIVANGVLTNGRVHANLNPDLGYMESNIFDSKYNTPCAFRPDSLVGYFKYTPSGSDALTVEVLLHTGTAKLPDTDSTNFIGYGLYTSANSTFSNWTRFSIPINYKDPANPEYILIILNAGNLTNAVSNSEAWFDDISLVGTTVSITQPLFGNTLNVYGGYNQINIDARQLERDSKYDLRVHDVLGKLVHRASITSGNNYEIGNLYSGIYICNMVSSQGMAITKKVIVQ